ncbi:GNAT family N-acetyltransferase [Martelella sp. AD-3]|uniref:GNAT family N-acetyltransferase n=1 Tax=Martelella sp. AD-3 TaxID=686597 RepID=UPI000465FEA1|nr:GNAT family N-acetyltransferase [Martelella sp. AD-3]AMM84291.1 acetyltransferase [Martelella sp. AD-3]MAM09075.1 N-acetyltransferase [Rhizobiaceae bacterium]
MQITVTADPDADDIARVDENLSRFNDDDVGPAERTPLSVFVRDGDGLVIAGINAFTAWGWLYVQRLWVGEDARGQGVAGKMLSAAEDAARARGCHDAFIDTFNPVALKAYQRAGYVEFGRMQNFVAGRDRVFLQKKL